MKKVFLLLVLALPFMVACSLINKNKKVYLEGDNLYMEMHYPTVGIDGFNNITWNKDDNLSELIEDAYKILKKEDGNREISIYARFVKEETDNYGNPKKSNEDMFLVKVPTNEVKKYKYYGYFNRDYSIKDKIVDRFKPVQNQEPSHPQSSNIEASNPDNMENYKDYTQGSINHYGKSSNTYDWLLATAYNPSLSVEDFIFMDWTVDNTQFLSYDAYLEFDRVCNEPIFCNANGCVDEEKLKKYYNRAAYMYEEFSTARKEDYYSYSMWDRTAPPNAKIRNPGFKMDRTH